MPYYKRGSECFFNHNQFKQKCAYISIKVYFKTVLSFLYHSRRFRDEAESFLCNILLPNLVWKAGRTAGALRTSALSCLLALLHGGAITPGQVYQRTLQKCS